MTNKQIIKDWAETFVFESVDDETLHKIQESFHKLTGIPIQYFWVSMISFNSIELKYINENQRFEMITWSIEPQSFDEVING